MDKDLRFALSFVGCMCCSGAVVGVGLWIALTEHFWMFSLLPVWAVLCVYIFSKVADWGAD